MKVLVFTSLYPNNIWPNHGVFVKERMIHFSKLEDCEIKVVAPVPYYPAAIKCNLRWQFSQIASKEIVDGVEVYHPRYLMPPKLGMAFYGVLMFLSVFSTIKRIKAEYNFDLIDAHYVYPDGFAAVLLGFFFGRPVVVSARGSDISLYASFPVIRWLLRYTLRRVNKVVAVCQALKDAMITLGIDARKIVVIPNGVDVGKFRRIPKEIARRQLNLGQDKKIILSVGNLIPRKGFDLLIKAVGMALNGSEHKKLQLVIVGEGPARQGLENLAASMGRKDAVVFAGAKPHSELYVWYSAADCFALASDREGWPNVILESLACGTPVVATDIWGIPEIITAGSLGVLTRRTEYALAEGISVAFRKQWSIDEIVSYAAMNSWTRSAASVRCIFHNVLLPRDRHLGQSDTHSSDKAAA